MNQHCIHRILVLVAYNFRMIVKIILKMWNYKERLRKLLGISEDYYNKEHSFLFIGWDLFCCTNIFFQKKKTYLPFVPHGPVFAFLK